MAKRGNSARKTLTDIIINALGDRYVTTKDKKIYASIPDDATGTDLVQFAIAFTMPKTPVAADTPQDTSAPTVAPTEISVEDKEKVTELLNKLNIDMNF